MMYFVWYCLKRFGEFFELIFFLFMKKGIINMEFNKNNKIVVSIGVVVVIGVVIGVVLNNVVMGVSIGVVLGVVFYVVVKNKLK